MNSIAFGKKITLFILYKDSVFARYEEINKFFNNKHIRYFGRYTKEYLKNQYPNISIKEFDSQHISKKIKDAIIHMYDSMIKLKNYGILFYKNHTYSETDYYFSIGIFDETKYRENLIYLYDIFGTDLSFITKQSYHNSENIMLKLQKLKRKEKIETLFNTN